MEFPQSPSGNPDHVYRILQFLIENEDQILANWQKAVRASFQVSLSEQELFQRLQEYFDALIQQIQEPAGVNSPDAQFLTDFAAIFTHSGSSHADIIEIIFLLLTVIEDFELFPGVQMDRDDIAQVKSHILHIMAKNAGNYFDQITQTGIRQQERFVTLLRVAEAASSSLDLDKVMRTISDEIVRALDAQSCNSFLFPERSRYGQYYLLDPLPPPGYAVPDPPELFGLSALVQKEPIICYDAALDPRTDKETVRFFGLKSLMAFPILYHGKAIASGIIVMKDYHHFTQEEIDLVMGIANSTAIAMVNAQMYQATKYLAIVEERNRISMEMHDHLAQALATIKLTANNLLNEELSEPVRESLQDIKTLADETYVDLRDTIFGLRAINESETQFLDNFKAYLATFGIHNHLQITISVSEESIRLLSGEALLQVGRILEEALNNVRKHARAKQVWIHSAIRGDVVWLSVEDDGIGMPPKLLNGFQEGHFGLKVMAERAESVGGRLTIKNRTSGGTCVEFVIPSIRKYEN
jgi:signal transduction histidine kinase